MSAELLKENARSLPIDPHSRHGQLQKLILGGFFDSPVPSEMVVSRILTKSGKRWKTNHVHTYMKKFMKEDIIQAVKRPGHNGNYWVLACVDPEDALRAIEKKGKIRKIEEELFSQQLTKSLEKDFGKELVELRENFGRNGNCTAFLLRKILEKLIIIVFAKHGKEHLLEDRSRPGGWVGLKDLMETAAREKLNGIPFLVPKTAHEIKGIKFLGDTAAHNPRVNVDISTILPQMPFIITAFQELANRL
ncbi:MAG TPA: hypothetical protein VFQ24_03640 [Terriglobia bacterium]|nr:hypothetical protein [Terriglobia bacterium]